MSNEEHEMTVDQIRTALDYMEQNYSLAMDHEDLGLARAFLDKIRFLQAELVRAITTADPYTSAADVRYFEGFDEQQAWYDTSAELL